MTPYWVLLILFAFAALVGGARLSAMSAGTAIYPTKPPRDYLLIFGAVLVALMIGFRYQVGGDWQAYRRMYMLAFYHSAGEMIQRGDPAYMLLSWGSEQVHGGLLLVDLVCGALFSWGLYRLAKMQPEPWLAMLVAVPYMIIVVAMGYSRQAVALGILMAGLARLMQGGSVISFLPYVAAAALFHKTAIIVLPVTILGVYRRQVFPILGAAIVGYILYTYLLKSALGDLVQNYIVAQYSSHGAAIRVLMIASAAVVFFVFRSRLRFNEVESKIWRNFSLASFAMFGALFIVPSSTVVDRLALYLLPLQVAVIGRVSLITNEQVVGRLIVIVYSAAVLYVWLTYAYNSGEWLPYKFYPMPSL